MDTRYTPEADSSEGLRIPIRPNRALSLRGMAVLFAGVTIVAITRGRTRVAVGNPERYLAKDGLNEKAAGRKQPGPRPERF